MGKLDAFLWLQSYGLIFGAILMRQPTSLTLYLLYLLYAILFFYMLLYSFFFNSISSLEKPTNRLCEIKKVLLRIPVVEPQNPIN